MAELVDALGLGSSGFMPWRFKSSYRHYHSSDMKRKLVELPEDLEIEKGFSYEMFPTPLGTFHAKESAYGPIHEQMRDVIYLHKEVISKSDNLHFNSENPSLFNASENGHTSFYGPSLVELPQFEPIGMFIYGNLMEYFKTICDAPFNIHLRNMWFTVYPEGHYIPRHSHPGSQMSGVYYFDVRSDSGELILHDPSSDFKLWFDEGINPASPFRVMPNVRIKPKTGDFVVFPSWLPHSTLPNKSKHDRIIFSYNFDLVCDKKEIKLSPFSQIDDD